MSRIVPFLTEKSRQPTQTTNANSMPRFQPEYRIAEVSRINFNDRPPLSHVCQICTLVKDSLFKFGKCDHSFCKLCLRQYLKQRIKGLQELRCCKSGCEEVLYLEKNTGNGQNDPYLYSLLSRKERKKIRRYIRQREKAREKCG